MIQDDEEINFHHKFNDSDIDRIPRNIAIKLLKQFAMNKGVGATDKYFVQKSLTQLHHELKEVRDEMAKQDKQPEFDNTVGAKFESTTQKSQSNVTNDQGQNTKPSHPKPPKLNEKQQRAHNLWGVDASNFNPSKDSTTNANVENDSMDNDEGYDVVTLNRREQYVHVKLETSSDLIHIPKKLEEFIRHLRSGDPNIHILPYHAISIKNSEIIGHEKSLPQEEEGISVYINNINTDSSKLFFSIRIASINIEKVKTSVYTYCKKPAVGLTLLHSNREKFSQQDFSTVCHLTIIIEMILKNIYIVKPHTSEGNLPFIEKKCFIGMRIIPKFVHKQ